MTLERTAANRLQGATLWASRAVWAVLAAIAVGLWGVSSFHVLNEPPPLAAEIADPSVFTQEDIRVLRDMGLPEALATVPEVFFILLGATYFLLGGWVFWRRSNESVTLLVSFALVFLGAVILGYTYEVATRVYPQWLPAVNALMLLGTVALALLLYVFPDGRFVPSWTRFLPLPLGATVFLSFFPVLEALGQAAGIVGMLGLLGTGTYARVHRFRYVSTPIERQQTKWIAIGLLGLVLMMLLWFILAAFPQNQPGPTRIYILLTVLPFGALIGILLPVCVAISVLRYRLWDIDIVLNRTAVYGPLTGILMGLYVGSIGLFQRLFVQFTGEQSSFAILLSTLVLAGAFMPLRIRLQSLADRYLKEVPNPDQGLKTLGEQMRSVAQLADVGQLTRRLLDETVAAFHAESGAVVVQGQSAQPLVQTAGAWGGTAAISVPLEHGGVAVGELSLGPRPKGQEYTPQDQEALQELAASAAQALALSLRARG